MFWNKTKVVRLRAGRRALRKQPASRGALRVRACGGHPAPRAVCRDWEDAVRCPIAGPVREPGEGARPQPRQPLRGATPREMERGKMRHMKERVRMPSTEPDE